MEAKTLPADVCVFGHIGQLSLAAVHLADCLFDSGLKWWIHVSSIVPYLRKNSFLLHWNSCKQCSESSMCCFWLTVKKCNTQFKYSFLVDKCSCKMVNTPPSDIFNSSAISHNFNLWLAKMSLWSLVNVMDATHLDIQSAHRRVWPVEQKQETGMTASSTICNVERSRTSESICMYANSFGISRA